MGTKKTAPNASGLLRVVVTWILSWAGCRGGFCRIVFGFRLAGGTRRLGWPGGGPDRRARYRANCCAGGRSDRGAGNRSDSGARRWADRGAGGWTDGGPSSGHRILALPQLSLDVLGRIGCGRTRCSWSRRLPHNVRGQGKTARDRDRANSGVRSFHCS